MLSEKLTLALSSYDKVILPLIEANCRRQEAAAARVLRTNLLDILIDLEAWERAAGPEASARISETVVLPDNVLRLAKVLNKKGVRVGPRPVGGGDAA